MGKVIPKHVADQMLLQTDGGVWFKRQFMVLLTACLIENSSNGYVIPQIMKCFSDIRCIPEWDWCGFVIRSLVENKIKWEKNKAKAFFGPALFITVRIVQFFKKISLVDGFVVLLCLKFIG